MFNTISWELFFVTVTILVGAYYFIVVLLLYAHEITRWRKSFFNKSHENVLVIPNEDVHVMGIRNESIPEEGAEKNGVSSSLTSGSGDALVGTVADLLEEIKTLIQLTAENNWDKSKSQSLFQALFARYSMLKNTTHQQSISEYIADASSDEFPFEISVAEAMTWWE